MWAEKSLLRDLGYDTTLMRLFGGDFATPVVTHLQMRLDVHLAIEVQPIDFDDWQLMLQLLMQAYCLASEYRYIVRKLPTV